MSGEPPTTSDPAPTCAECGGGRPLAGAADDQQVTHCEWCGAEYPIPHQEGPPAAPGS